MPKTQDVEIHVQVQFKDEKTGDLDRFASDLHEEMRALHLQVKPAKGGRAPAGSKSLELAVVGAWTVKAAPTVIPPLLALLKDWITRQSGAPLKLTVKRGIKSVTIEYDPRKTSVANVEAMANRLLR